MRIEDFYSKDNQDTELISEHDENSLDYLKTVVAFANGKGGQIVFGVDSQSREVTGIDEESIFDEIKAITNEIDQYCSPAIVPAIYPKSIDGKTILLVEISSGQDKPYFIKQKRLSEGVYFRCCGQSRKADFALSQELYFDAHNRCYDQKIREDFKITKEEIQLLCRKLKNQALKNCQSEKEKTLIKEITKEDLISWGILSRNRQGDLCPTNAWIFLTGQDAFSSRIQCALFQGNNRARFLERQDCTGPVWQQIEQAYQFVLSHIQNDCADKIEEKDRFQFPAEGVKELLVFAVVNCSYIQQTSIQVAIYDNRLEITSPGGLMPDMTIERLKEGYAQIRNKALARALSYMNLIQQWGNEVPALFEQMKEYGLPDPEILDMDSALRINLYRKQQAVSNKDLIERKLELERLKELNIPSRSLGKFTRISEKFLHRELSRQESLIIDYIEHNGQIRSQQAAELLELKIRRAQGILSQLVKNSLIKRKGATRNTYYIFNSSLLKQ